MKYQSTRDQSVSISSAEAIARGISPDGGLYVPEEFPAITAEWIGRLAGMDYMGRAKAVLSLFLTDYTAEEPGRKRPRRLRGHL